jgi:hypothetical protein
MDYFAPLVLAAFLLFSAAAKTFQYRALQQALERFVHNTYLARRLAQIASPAEWTVAVLLLIKPSSVLARACLIALFAAFAVLGVAAIVTGALVDCGCLGNFHSSRLGWSQVIQFLVVLSVTLFWFPRRDWPLGQALLLTSLVQVLVAMIFVAKLASLWRIVRRQRQSLAASAAGQALSEGLALS